MMGTTHDDALFMCGVCVKSTICIHVPTYGQAAEPNVELARIAV